MNEQFFMWLIAETILVVGAVVVSHVRTQVRLAKLELQCEHINDNTEGLKDDHDRLAAKVDGISRHVAMLEGKL